MTGDYLETARRRLTALRQPGAIAGVLRASEREISEITLASRGLSSLISHISQSVSMQTEPDEALSKARKRIGELRRAGGGSAPHCEISEKSEKGSVAVAPPMPLLLADPLRAWRLRNSDLLTDLDRRLGHDPGGFCAAHGRSLSYPEQRRGACSWCVSVDPGREPTYWASHQRRFTGR